MSEWPYTQGLHEIGNGIYAYLQPDGGWGLNNAGLVVDGDQSMVVDTLYDLKLTRGMLDAMQTATPAAESIDVLFNTHVNGDHCFGNQLFEGAEIIASQACAEEFETESPPQLMIDMLKAAPQMGELGEFFARCFGKFDFEGIAMTAPTRTFEGRMDIEVGGKEIQFIEVGPCHTRGDSMVYIPGDSVLFAGDILFNTMSKDPVKTILKDLNTLTDFLSETKGEEVVRLEGSVLQEFLVDRNQMGFRRALDIEMKLGRDTFSTKDIEITLMRYIEMKNEFSQEDQEEDSTIQLKENEADEKGVVEKKEDIIGVLEEEKPAKEKILKAGSTIE